MTNAFRLTEISSSTLSNRENGRKVREKILNLARQSGQITIDMENISTVTPSFLEEAIVKLVVELGKDRFKQTIELVNLNDALREMMNMMLANQLKRQKQETPQ